MPSLSGEAMLRGGGVAGREFKKHPADAAAVRLRGKRAGLQIRRNGAAQLFQTGARAVQVAPFLDVAEIEGGTLDSEDGVDVLNILGPCPAEFLDDQIFGCRNPRLAIEDGNSLPAAACKFRLMMRIVALEEHFDFEWPAPVF